MSGLPRPLKRVLRWFRRKNRKPFFWPRFLIGLYALSLLIMATGIWKPVWITAEHLYRSSTAPPPQVHTNSKIDNFTFQPVSLGEGDDAEDREINVYLPPDYDEAKMAAKKYPVLYLLHGDPGTNQDWLLNAQMQNKLDELVLGKEIPPMIVVFPDGNGPVYSDSEYLDSAKQNQYMESYIAGDLVQYIDQNYRTLPDRQARAIGGVSSGGYGAANILLHHLDTFSILMSESGYFSLQPDPQRSMLGTDRKLINFNTPLVQITTLTLPENTFIYMDNGEEDDKFVVDSNHKMNALLDKLGIDHTYNESAGNHGWNMWSANAEDGLKFVGQHIAH